MKLITETSYNVSANKKENKSLYIEGIFSTASIKNRNGRIYTKRLLEREVDRFRDLVVDKKALGELEHPSQSSVNLDRASILIEDLV